jgi:hypothetical protein
MQHHHQLWTQSTKIQTKSTNFLLPHANVVHFPKQCQLYVRIFYLTTNLRLPGVQDGTTREINKMNVC